MFQAETQKMAQTPLRSHLSSRYNSTPGADVPRQNETLLKCLHGECRSFNRSSPFYRLGHEAIPIEMRNNA